MKKIFVIVPIFIGIVLILFLINKFEMKDRVSVETFGSEKNDAIDDTRGIQNAIDYAHENGFEEVFFPKGLYLLDAIKTIRLKSNITLKFDDGTVLQALPNDSESYEIISIKNVENVSLIGKVIIIGERSKHIGETGEWGFGISIRGSENVYIENPTIRDNWGDGIYIGSTESKNYSKDVTIINPIIENNRRQGITVISAINLEIKNPKVFNTNGTPPAFGIDFEPNNKGEYLQNIKLMNPLVEGNKGGGIQFYLKNIQNSKNPIDIEISVQSGVKDGIVVLENDNVKGEIKITNIDD
ncbi:MULTISPECIES: right-handed parallel beta-helix repeat-containing protein [unclassified Peribacillus]|uniref:right-handed parallel beta-helix repeat-containing protein n=1 Tax=unclassified Peribacillus TaxID=2675266 RepID=UPI00366F1115